MTNKTPDQILDGAADILEADGWVTDTCYDAKVGGYCALGAIAKATFPKLAKTRISDRAYVSEAKYNDGRYGDGAQLVPAHLEAVEFLASRIRGKKDGANDADVSSFNDRLPSGVESEYDWRTDSHTFTVDEKLRFKSSRKVVQRLRNAAKAYRKQQEKRAA